MLRCQTLDKTDLRLSVSQPLPGGCHAPEPQSRPPSLSLAATSPWEQQRLHLEPLGVRHDHRGLELVGCCGGSHAGNGHERDTLT